MTATDHTRPAPGRLLGRELTGAAIVAAVIVVLTAALPWLRDRDIAMSVFRAREAERSPDPEILAAIREELNLPDNPIEGIAQWLGGAVRGDFGVSWVNPSQGALEVAWSGLGFSLSIALASVLAAVGVAALLALPRINAVVTGRNWGNGDVLASSLIGSIPVVVSASALLVIFGLRLGWFPVSGLDTPWHYVLPVTALALHSGGLLGRILIIAVDGLKNEQWITSWRVNGVPRRARYAAVAHRAWVILGPQVTLMLASTVAATVLVEETYNIPGFGLTALTAAKNQDIPVLQVVLLTTVAIGLVLGLVSRAMTARLLGPMARADNTYASFTGMYRRGSSRADVVAVICALTPIGLILLGLFQPNPAVDPAQRLMAPGPEHPLGTDQLGRDLFARLAHGAPYTLGTALAVTAICAVLGVVLGLLGTWAQRVGTVLNALPEVFVGIILAGVFGGSLWVAAAAVVLVGWIPLAAHASAVAGEVRASGYVAWARLQGAGRGWILRRHILPAVVPAVVRHSASRVAANALALASLGYLGIGAPHDSPEWGVVLSESLPYAERAPWLVIAPTVLLLAVGAASSLAADLRIPRKK